MYTKIGTLVNVFQHHAYSLTYNYVSMLWEYANSYAYLCIYRKPFKYEIFYYSFKYIFFTN